jgi:hypothetical protein
MTKIASPLCTPLPRSQGARRSDASTSSVKLYDAAYPSSSTTTRPTASLPRAKTSNQSCAQLKRSPTSGQLKSAGGAPADDSGIAWCGPGAVLRCCAAARCLIRALRTAIDDRRLLAVRCSAGARRRHSLGDNWMTPWIERGVRLVIRYLLGATRPRASTAGKKTPATSIPPASPPLRPVSVTPAATLGA